MALKPELLPLTLHDLHSQSDSSLDALKNNVTPLRARKPKYRVAQNMFENPQIPDPRLFKFSVLKERANHREETEKGHSHDGAKRPQSNNNDDTNLLPSLSHCATHLKLLSAFYQLRYKVLNSTDLDLALGIVPLTKRVYRLRRTGRWVPAKIGDSSFKQRREGKWPLFVLLAVVRFLRWARAVEGSLIEGGGFEQGQGEAGLLPPIDVLMVWHAALLNPAWFRSLGFKTLAQCAFPWEEINSTIDSNKPTWPYTLPEASSTAFTENTSLAADLFAFLTGTSAHTETFSELLKKHTFIKPNTETPPEQSEKASTPLALTREEITKALESFSADQYAISKKFTGSEIAFLETYCSALTPDETSTLVHDLSAAVHRQVAFTAKMESHCWIRSPALEGTLTRALDRYAKFVRLFKLCRGTLLVPTLDIDLVWHTHQCSHAAYSEAMMRLAGRLINHDDKLGKSVLGDGLEGTVEAWRMRFGGEYERCFCWDCEMLLDEVERYFEEERVNMEKGKRGERGKWEGRIAWAVSNEVEYHRVVEIARRKGDLLLPVPVPIGSPSLSSD
ncbi:hypothetical protein BJX64DRAFT_285614 [Aspergillus heterothallicus]